MVDQKQRLRRLLDARQIVKMSGHMLKSDTEKLPEALSDQVSELIRLQQPIWFKYAGYHVVQELRDGYGSLVLVTSVITRDVIDSVYNSLV